MNKTSGIWKLVLDECLNMPDYVASPRGMEVREVIGGNYAMPMPAFIDLVDREVNVNFMFAEAAWIISGSNRLDDITPYLKGYSKFSDDGVFMRGAYGPKIVDQLGYIVDTIAGDIDTRQALLTIWRERPGPSKDIPCTVAMQFLVRGGELHCNVTMRSQDIVFGFTYDVFTFSMVARAVQLLLKARGIDVNLGKLYVTAGSMHLYKRHYEDAKKWLKSTKVDASIKESVASILGADKYEDLVEQLKTQAVLHGEAQ